MINARRSGHQSGFSSWVRGKNGLSLTKQATSIGGNVMEYIGTMI